MNKKIALVFFGAYLICIPLAAFALVSQQEAQPPGQCEKTCDTARFNCSRLGVVINREGDQQCARERFNQPTYTSELTTYGNSNGCRDSEQDADLCASGSCTSYGGQPVLGLAHRSFPFGTRIEVCNLKNQICAIATVVDRGPSNVYQKRTLDAYSTLSKSLQMNCGTVPATYKVLSGPGVSGEAPPSGPTVAGIEAILDAQRSGNGVGPAGMTYTGSNTPWGYGYVGTPPPIGSAAYGQMGTGVPVGQNTNTGTNNYGNTNYYPTNPYGQTTTASSSSKILVQPKTVSRGQVVLVSWTSVNMAKDSCAVTFQNQSFAQGAEGTKPFKTVSSDSGTLTFTLTCTDALGAQSVSSGSTQIQ